ncbi:MAG TPA: ATP-dependent zinc metalloprotease FtsH [Bacillota bacterium]|nr:ATP-dependent zinc metalloprotease FtsH [Bacillota bacterium]
MKNNGRVLMFYILFVLAIIFIGSYVMNQPAQKELQYSDIVAMFKNDQVQSFKVEPDYELKIVKKDGTKVSYKLASLQLFYEDLHEIYEKNVAEYDFIAPTDLPWWVNFLPYLIVIAIMVFVWWMFISRATKGTGTGGGIGGLGGRMNSFSKARTRLGSEEKNKVYFSDVAGADEEKQELQEIVEFLKNPGKFANLGARIPKGVLLVGAPGTGKTLLAKAVAGESGVPFYSISGSDFVEMYVGVGASRVRDLFETAKKTAPCIIFIDEIDAVGRHRGAGWGGGHDEREQTLNQLLVEMDGFGANDGVIVIAATNRPDILDPALLRPGRFDRQITVNYPDIKGRTEILKVHARNKPLEDDVNLETIAKSTAGFTGADLSNLLNEAALLAARRGKNLIGMREIEESIIKVLVGPQKKSLVIKEEDKRKTAYHEAGHAIVTRFLPTQNPVHQISIIPSGRALGYTLSLPQVDKTNVYKQELLETIATLLGGRAAEKLVLNDISGGAANDISRATEIARKMVTQYGMSEKLGPIVYGTGHDEVFLGKDYATTRNYSENVAAEIDKEIHAIITKAYNMAEKILKDNMHVLHFIADYLVKHEVMDSEQFELCFTEGVTPEMLDAVRERKVNESIEANRKRNEQIIEENKRKSEEMNNPNHTENSDGLM